MKKNSVITSLSLFTILASSIVSAETNFERWSASGANTLSALLESIKVNPEILTTILLGILLWIIIYSIASQIFRVDTESWKGTVISGAVSLIIVILSFIALPSGTLEVIALQYSAMGATILTFIPFAIMLYFTTMVSKSRFISQVIWVFYVLYYFALFIYKIAIASTTTDTGLLSPDNIPYLAAIIAGIVIFFLIGTFRNLIFKGKLDSRKENAMKDINLRKTVREMEREEGRARGITE